MLVTSNKGTTNYIVYTYDATGRKLSQQVFDTTPKITDYIDEYIYEDNVLQLINHEEGRIIPSTGEYQYHLKDHLGNVRLTFSENTSTSEYQATFERSPASIETQENSLFLNIVNSKKINFAANNHTPGSGKTYGYRLSGTTGEVIGPAKSIAVSAGDALDLEVYAKYNAPTNTGSGIGTFGTAIIGAFGLTPGGTNPIDGGQAHSAFSSWFSGGAWIGPSDYEDEGAPKAFLNYLLFDANFNLMDAGFDQVTTAGAATHDHLSLHVKVKQAGYLYVYLSNENSVIQDVYFDDFRIKYSTKVEQSDDYYPFGLTFNSYSRENSVDQKFKFQGQEHIDDLDLGWDSFKWRNHQPDIGRFFNVDPLAEKFYYNSPYAFSENKVTTHVELEGLEAFGIHGTWSSSATWENQEALSEVMHSAYGNNESNFEFNWSGDNLSSARSEAALELISYVRSNRSEDPNEPITLIGHSHGGNVAIEAVNMMSGMEEFNGVNINLVTINTPVREDYQLSEEAAARVQHVNVYDEKDPVQIRGGNDPSKFTGDTKVNTLKPYTVEAGKRNGLTMTGEKGDAGRTFKNAINIKTTKSQGVTGDFHNSHNRVKDWKNEFLLKAGQ